jgi:hypothetical protein
MKSTASHRTGDSLRRRRLEKKAGAEKKTGSLIDSAILLYRFALQGTL